MKSVRYNATNVVVEWLDDVWVERAPSGEMYGPFKGREEAFDYLKRTGQIYNPFTTPVEVKQ